MKTELDKQIAKRMATGSHIPAKIMAVVKYHSAEQRIECRHLVKVLGICGLTIEGGSMELSYESHGPQNEFIYFAVRYDGSLMFAATTTRSKETFRGEDPRRVAKCSVEGWVCVEKFIPGIWMHALDLKRLIRQEERAKQEAEKRRQEQTKIEATSLYEDGARIAERFGIKIS